MGISNTDQVMDPEFVENGQSPPPPNLGDEMDTGGVSQETWSLGDQGRVRDP